MRRNYKSSLKLKRHMRRKFKEYNTAVDQSDRVTVL